MIGGARINGLDYDEVCRIIEAGHFSGCRDKSRMLAWAETVYFILGRPEVGKALAESLGLTWIPTDERT